MGDVNYVHPFREGNGRTQLQYLKKLGQQAGHNIDLAKLEPKGWIEASKRAHATDYALMSRAIEDAIGGRSLDEFEVLDAAGVHERAGHTGSNKAQTAADPVGWRPEGEGGDIVGSRRLPARESGSGGINACQHE